jgi:5-methylcytosine-specific restriction protein A
MMARALPEWIGKTANSAIPPRVKDRIAHKAVACCQKCRREVGGRLRAEFDHIIPLILGGENRETNLQLLCHECHKAKTQLDVKLKAKVARVRKRHLGFVAPRQKIKSRGFPTFKPQRTASRPLSKTVERQT